MRRRQSEDHARHRRDRQREQQHGHVDGDLGLVGDRIRRHERQDDSQRTVGERRAGHAARHRQKHALGQQLPHQTPAAAAERGAHRHLPLPARGSREQQVRDIGARNQQQQADRAKEDPQVLADAARKCLFERQQPDPPHLRVLQRCPQREILDDRLEVGRRLRLGHARLQPSEQVDVPDALDDASTLERDREVDVGPTPHESLRHDPDNGPHRAVQPQLTPDDARVAAELTLPESVAEYDDRRGVRSSIVGQSTTGRGAPARPSPETCSACRSCRAGVAGRRRRSRARRRWWRRSCLRRSCCARRSRETRRWSSSCGTLPAPGSRPSRSSARSTSL